MPTRETWFSQIATGYKDEVPHAFTKEEKAAIRAAAVKAIEASKNSLPDPQYFQREKVEEVIHRVAPAYQAQDEEMMAQQKAAGQAMKDRILDTNIAWKTNDCARAFMAYNPDDKRRVMLFAHYGELIPELKDTMQQVRDLYYTIPDKAGMSTEVFNAAMESYKKKMEPLFSHVKKTVLQHSLDNADTFFEKLTSTPVTPKRLIENWPEWMAKLSLYGEGQQFFDRNHMDEKSYAECMAKMEKGMAILADMNTMADFIISPLAGLVDYREISKLNHETVNRIAAEMNPNTEQGAVLQESISMGNQQKQSAFAAAANRKLGLSGSPLFFVHTLDGRVFDLNSPEATKEMMVDQRPVYLMSKLRPEEKPSLVLPTNQLGGALTDEQIPRSRQTEPAPVNRASGFQRFWNRVCKTFHMNGLRPKACVEYEKAKADYDARTKVRTEYEQLTSPEKLEQVKENICRKQFGKSGAEYTREVLDRREAAAAAKRIRNMQQAIEGEVSKQKETAHSQLDAMKAKGELNAAQNGRLHSFFTRQASYLSMKNDPERFDEMIYDLMAADAVQEYLRTGEKTPLVEALRDGKDRELKENFLNSPALKSALENLSESDRAALTNAGETSSPTAVSRVVNRVLREMGGAAAAQKQGEAPQVSKQLQAPEQGAKAMGIGGQAHT